MFLPRSRKVFLVSFILVFSSLLGYLRADAHITANTSQCYVLSPAALSSNCVSVGNNSYAFLVSSPPMGTPTEVAFSNCSSYGQPTNSEVSVGIKCFQVSNLPNYSGFYIYNSKYVVGYPKPQVGSGGINIIPAPISGYYSYTDYVENSPSWFINSANVAHFCNGMPNGWGCYYHNSSYSPLAYIAYPASAINNPNTSSPTSNQNEDTTPPKPEELVVKCSAKQEEEKENEVYDKKVITNMLLSAEVTGSQANSSWLSVRFNRSDRGQVVVRPGNQKYGRIFVVPGIKGPDVTVTASVSGKSVSAKCVIPPVPLEKVDLACSIIPFLRSSGGEDVTNLRLKLDKSKSSPGGRDYKYVWHIAIDGQSLLDIDSSLDAEDQETTRLIKAPVGSTVTAYVTGEATFGKEQVKRVIIFDKKNECKRKVPPVKVIAKCTGYSVEYDETEWTADYNISYGGQMYKRDILGDDIVEYKWKSGGAEYFEVVTSEKESLLEIDKKGNVKNEVFISPKGVPGLFDGAFKEGDTAECKVKKLSCSVNQLNDHE